MKKATIFLIVFFVLIFFRLAHGYEVNAYWFVQDGCLDGEWINANHLINGQKSDFESRSIHRADSLHTAYTADDKRRFFRCKEDVFRPNDIWRIEISWRLEDGLGYLLKKYYFTRFSDVILFLWTHEKVLTGPWGKIQGK